MAIFILKMYTTQKQSTAELNTILRYQGEIGSHIPGREASASQGIAAIVKITFDKGNASFGIRVLSEFGAQEKYLRSLTQDFNKRSTSPNHDIPTIEHFYMKNSNGFDFDRYDVVEKNINKS